MPSICRKMILDYQALSFKLSITNMDNILHYKHRCSQLGSQGATIKQLVIIKKVMEETHHSNIQKIVHLNTTSDNHLKVKVIEMN